MGNLIKMKNKLFRIYSSIFIITVLSLTPITTWAQLDDFIAIIPPFMDRQYSGGHPNQLQLTEQLYIIFLYRNAAIVYTEADFINSGSDTIEYELGLPSTGFRVKDDKGKSYQSNGILSVQIWISGERIGPEIQQDGDVEWYTINSIFSPSLRTKVKALFWVQTSLTDIDSLPGLDTIKISDGKRGFLLNVSSAAMWQDVISSFRTIVVFKDGLTPSDTLDANPDNYESGDSTISWKMQNIEPADENNISLFYNSASKKNSRMDTMRKLSQFIVKKGYDDILEYVYRLEED